ncbi:unnamed protein product [Durusdinium trenchii]|uniref:Uncharacterized protein n=1 Tax=Durusdinium trenchii TaxID=1381693 RepID=A0ABP0J3M5_9DINO
MVPHAIACPGAGQRIWSVRTDHACRVAPGSKPQAPVNLALIPVAFRKLLGPDLSQLPGAACLIQDVENKHFQISLQLQNRSEITERMKHYYPLALVILLIAIEVVFLEANGYMHLVREKLAKYAFFWCHLLGLLDVLIFRRIHAD